MFNNQNVYVLCNIQHKYNKCLCQDVTSNYDSFFVDSRDHSSVWDPERHEESDEEV